MRIIKSSNRFHKWKVSKASWALSLLVLIPLTMLAGYGIGWRLEYFDHPQPSDIVVVLGGGFSRPFYAADLYHEGYSHKIWLSRPVRQPAEVLLDNLGIPYPHEKEINREILVRKGVPEEKIRFYGNGVKSTADEALALKAALEPRGEKIMVVTSRWHARRASWIFSSTLSGASVRVVATPYETFSRRWGKNQELARAALLEPVKMLYFR